jgi:hypothetical protein
MKKLYFKAMRGWGEDFVSFEIKDLPKAYKAQATGDIFIANGSIAGNKIEMIVPDYHKTMGWNYDYRLEPEDYAQIKKEAGDMQNIAGIIGEKVKYLLKEKQDDIIDTILIEDILREYKNQLEQRNPEIKKISDSLANKFKI